MAIRRACAAFDNTRAPGSRDSCRLPPSKEACPARCTDPGCTGRLQAGWGAGREAPWQRRPPQVGGMLLGASAQSINTSAPPAASQCCTPLAAAHRRRLLCPLPMYHGHPCCCLPTCPSHNAGAQPPDGAQVTSLPQMVSSAVALPPRCYAQAATAAAPPLVMLRIADAITLQHMHHTQRSIWYRVAGRAGTDPLRPTGCPQPLPPGCRLPGRVAVQPPTPSSAQSFLDGAAGCCACSAALLSPLICRRPVGSTTAAATQAPPLRRRPAAPAPCLDKGVASWHLSLFLTFCRTH